MFEFFLSKLSPLGDNDPKWGQAYWGEANGETLPIKFNSMNPHIQAGMTITADEKAMKKSTKGTTYWQLKKVKVVEAAPAPQNTPTESVRASQSPSTDKFSEIMNLLNKIGYDVQEIRSDVKKLLTNDAELGEPDVVHDALANSPDGDPPMPEDWLL